MLEEKPQKINFISIAVLLLFFGFCFLLLLSLVGWFNIYFISGGLLIFLILLIIFHQIIESPKKYFLFLIFICLLVFGITLFKGFFSGDATNYWLPLSREIVLGQKMPDILLNLTNFTTTRGPLLPLLFASTFIFTPLKEIFVIWIPILFCFLTFIILYQWAKDKGLDKKYIFFAILLFLTNPIFFKYGWDILQEPIILFFFTSFFYFLERYEKDNNSLNLFLIFISFILALLSKESAIFLSLPFIFYFFRHKFYKDKKFILILLSFVPLIVWFLRNYLIFDNPIYPLFNSFFKGGYFAVAQRASQFILAPMIYENYRTAISFVVKELLIYFPFIIFSLYGFLKKKKYIYLLVFTLFLLGEISLPGVDKGAIKHYYPLLGLLIIYALEGLKEMKSKTVLSILFGLSFVGLFFTPFITSQSPFIIPIENSLSIFSSFIKIIIDYKFIVALFLILYFYLFLAKKDNIKLLLLSLFTLYLVKTSTIQISWLNIWLPILIFLIITLFWSFSSKYAEKLAISLIILILFINSWGLASSYFLSHKKFVFPKEEAYGILPKAGEIISQREKNKDFYILVGCPTILNWRYNYKILLLNGYTFNLVTNLQYKEHMSAKEIKDLFNQTKIKYIVKNDNFQEFKDFYEEIKPASEYFEPLYQENDFFVWRVKN